MPKNPGGEAKPQNLPQNPPPSSDASLPPEIAIFHRSREVSGPLPSPEVLFAYERASPGLAVRIVAMAQKAMDEALEEDKKLLDARIADMKASRQQTGIGQYLAFAIAFVAILTAGYLGARGAQATASIIGGGTVVALVGSFLYRNANIAQPPTPPSPPAEQTGK